MIFLEELTSHRESDSDVLGHFEGVRCLRADWHVVINVGDLHIDGQGRRAGHGATVDGDHPQRDGVGGETLEVDRLLQFNQTRG